MAIEFLVNKIPAHSHIKICNCTALLKTMLLEIAYSTYPVYEQRLGSFFFGRAIFFTEICAYFISPHDDDNYTLEFS